jgi:peptidoglycan biosynthesis protein MviN/MurJ (putative lipid II flippase)
MALPAALGLAILAIPLIATLFHHGAFDAHDVAMTGQALTAYSVGLVGLIVVKVLAPGFYARQNIKTPVKIGVLTLVATQLMNVAFILPMRHAGLAMAIGLGACLNAWLLYRKLRQHSVYQRSRAGPGSRPNSSRRWRRWGWCCGSRWVAWRAGWPAVAWLGGCASSWWWGWGR